MGFQRTHVERLLLRRKDGRSDVSRKIDSLKLAHRAAAISR